MIVALYARVSTSKQAEKDLSIPDQLRQMRDWCKANRHTIALEYVEPGASAMDDKRPAFQQMIADACASPAPYSAIIVHSLSRFFRDHIELGFYERRLKKHDVRLISITQQTADDSAGEMARSIFSLFDEYQSKENSKHTLRAMKENARQGYFNGSRPPYGYRKKELPIPGRKGKKKQLEIDPAEAAIVKDIFKLYLSGHQGRALGVKGVASLLNDRSVTMRGGKWNKTLVYELIANRTYVGEYFFNKTEAKTRKRKPQSEWVQIAVEPIIDVETFNLAVQRRVDRSPAMVPPRIVNSPTLLTGLLRCGECGARMTLATGKGGKYHYYKCSTRINQIGRKTCQSSNIPMEKLDGLVLQAVADRVFKPERVKTMLTELLRAQKKSGSTHKDQLKALTKELDNLKSQSDRLYEAVEKGLLPMDVTLQERVHKHQARRQEILTEIAGLRREQELPVERIEPGHVNAFCSALKSKLQEKSSGLGKEYLKLLVDEIRVDGNKVSVRGSHAALAAAIAETKLGARSPMRGRVPSFGSVWLPMPDSN
jgi:DNA invertase Pin-like site-specific DNA recombinase